MCRDLRLAAITGELGLGNIREASIDQVRAVQDALTLAGEGKLTDRQLEVIRDSLSRSLVDSSGVPIQRTPMLAGVV